MKRSRECAAVLCALLPAAGCGRAAPTRTLARGVVIEDFAEGSGDEVSPGRWLAVDYAGWLLDGTPFDSTSGRGAVYTFPYGVGHVIPGFDVALEGMRAGGRRRAWIPPEAAYGDTGKGARIPAGSTLVYDIELREMFRRTASGLQYRAVVPGEGAPPRRGAVVVVEYVGRLPSTGREFDSSRKRGRAFEFRLGEGVVIPAWDEGIALMRPGALYEFVVPPSQGYGELGLGHLIPPHTDVFYEIELIGIRKADAP